MIFGKFGVPPLGVAGSALGTAIARAVEMTLYLLFLRRGRSYFRFDLKNALALPRAVVAGLFRRSLPLTVNELIYALGINLYFWMVSNIDHGAVSAYNIADLAFQLGSVLIAGVPSAVGILVGAPLGAGDFKIATSNARRMAGLVGAVSVGGALITAACAFALPAMYHLGPGVKGAATMFMLTQAVLFPVNALYSLSFFLLRVGGEVKIDLAAVDIDQTGGLVEVLIAGVTGQVG